MEVDSEELKNYVNSVLKAIQSSEETNKDFSLNQGITFDLSIVHKKQAKGGVKLLIADAEGGYEKQVVSRITFTMNSKKGVETGIKQLRGFLQELKKLDDNSETGT